MSFELKPLSELGIGASELRNTNDIVWTHERNSVPPLLADRIQLNDWQQTFDGVKAQYELILQHLRTVRQEFSSPCFLCCSMNSIMAASAEVGNAWVKLLEREQQRYNDACVQVKFDKEIKTIGVGSNRNIHQEIVGLSFTPTPRSGHGPSTHATAATKPATKGEHDLTQQLNTLHQIYQTGGLTEEEYTAAKAKILKF